LVVEGGGVYYAPAAVAANVNQTVPLLPPGFIVSHISNSQYCKKHGFDVGDCKFK
jgi:hypothetical protein